MAEHKNTNLRSLAEAHLYVAVAKADGIVTIKERARAPYYAQKSQSVFNILQINREVKTRIKKDVQEMLEDKAFYQWSATQHLDKAVALLKEAKKAGDWGATLSIHKNEQGLLQLALVDGYILKESKFIQEIEQRLKELDS